MRILDITTFLALARLRHFARAARELNTTQPAISMRLAALEDALRCRLVNRRRGGFSLTPEGERAARSFETMLAELDGLRAALGGGPARAGETIRIGAIDTVSSTWMPRLVEELRRQSPGLKVELTIESTRNLATGMEQGRYDIVFALDPVIGEAYRSFVITMFEMAWIGSAKVVDPDHVYSVEELAQLPIVSFPAGTPPFRMVAPYFNDESVLASKLTSSNSLYSIINLVIEGFGIGAIPTVTVQRELDNGLLHLIATAKKFDPMPIIATYQAATRAETIAPAIALARDSARRYCATVAGRRAWMP